MRGVEPKARSYATRDQGPMRFKLVNLSRRSNGCCRAGRVAVTGGRRRFARVVAVVRDVCSTLTLSGSVAGWARGRRGPAAGGRVDRVRATRAAWRPPLLLDRGGPEGARCPQ